MRKKKDNLKWFDDRMKLSRKLFSANNDPRTTVILMTSFVETALREVLDEYLKLYAPLRIRNKLFSLKGPMGTLEYKLDFARAIGLMGDVEYNNALCIASIRNEFAHSFEVTTYGDSNKIVSHLKNLKNFEIGLKEEPLPKDPHQRFTRAASHVISMLEAHREDAEAGYRPNPMHVRNNKGEKQ